MKSTFVSAVLVMAVTVFVGCEEYGSRPPKRGSGGWHPPKPLTDPPVETPDPNAPEPAPKPPEAPVPPQSPIPEPTKPVGEIPYAKPVPGKPGFVTSPNFPYKGYIDVRGYPPGTEVKDPYDTTGKSFLVP